MRPGLFALSSIPAQLLFQCLTCRPFAGERLSPWVAMACIIMGFAQLLS